MTNGSEERPATKQMIYRNLVLQSWHFRSLGDGAQEMVLGQLLIKEIGFLVHKIHIFFSCMN